MHLDEEPIGTDRNSGSRKRCNFIAFAGSMAGIDENRQMAQALNRGDQTQVEGVAGVVSEGAHTALAEGHFIVSLAHDVLGGHEELFQRG